MLVRYDTKLIEKSVMPNLFHVIPIIDNSVLNRILEQQNTSLGHSIVTHVRVPLSSTNHHTLLLWPPNDTGKNDLWCLIIGKASLDTSSTIVYNDGSDRQRRKSTKINLVWELSTKLKGTQKQR